MYNHDQPADPRSVSSGKSVSKPPLWRCCCTSKISGRAISPLNRSAPCMTDSAISVLMCVWLNECGMCPKALGLVSRLHLPFPVLIQHRAQMLFPAQCLIWTLDGAVAHRTPNVPACWTVRLHMCRRRLTLQHLVFHSCVCGYFVFWVYLKNESTQWALTHSMIHLCMTYGALHQFCILYFNNFCKDQGAKLQNTLSCWTQMSTYLLHRSKW